MREWELFRAARVRSGMLQKQMADAAGVSTANACKYESGQLGIPSDVAVSLQKTPMGGTKPFYALVCARCEAGKMGYCDGTKCAAGQALSRRKRQDLRVAA